MDELIPIYRIEFFLDAIVNNTTPPEPIYRAEFYLAKIAGADVEIPEPVYRMEKYLAYLCGEEVELPDPIYRIEYYLAILCGLNVELPEPIYRVEFWLWDWCGGGGIEKTVTGNPIHITDALAKPAQALSVKLEPIQDLHGYDNPWPSGGGVNKLNPNTVTAGYIGSDGILYPASETMREYYTDFIPISPSTTYTVGYFGYASGEAPWKAFGWYDANKIFISRDASSSTDECWKRTSPSNAAYARASFRTYNHGVEKGLFALGTVSTYSPYSNICPISGHADADVTRTGVNVWDGTYTADHVVRSTDGEIESSASTWCASNYIPVKGGSSYYLNDFSTQYAGVRGIAWYDKDKAYISGVSAPQNQNYGVQTAPENAAFLRVTIESAKIAETSINYPSTDTTYHAYVGTTYPIPLGQTVYGGTLDVVTGVLTVTHAVGEYDGSADENWVVYSAGNGYYISVTDMQSLNNGDVISNYLDKYSGVSNLGIRLGFNNNVAYIYQANTLNGVTDLASWKAHLAQTPLQVFYPLATPQTIQLTPQQVELLQGENNIWSDGEMTLVYLADGNASDVEALNILLGGRYVNNHGEDEPTDREALDILLGRTK